MNTAALIMGQFPRFYGVPWRAPAIELPSLVSLAADAPLVLDRDPSFEVPGSFEVQRAGNSGSSCEVGWRVVPATSDPVPADMFKGGAYPSGVAVFEAGELVQPVTVLLSPGADPARDSSVRIELEAPEGCVIDEARSSLTLTVLGGTVVPEDAVVGLSVLWSELDPELGGPLPGGAYDLGPDWSVNWTLQQANPANSSITQESNGVVLEAGTESDGDIFLFAKTAPTGRWKFSVLYTWLDGLAGEEGGTFTRFGYTRGKGSGGIEADPNLWSAADAGDLSDTTMDSNSKGVRASLNTKNSGGMAALSNQIRKRAWDPAVAGTPAIAPSIDPPTYDFADSVEYLLEITRDGSTMTYRKTAAGKPTQSVSFTAPEIGAIGEAWILWGAVSGRKFRIREAKMTPLTGGDANTWKSPGGTAWKSPGGAEWTSP